MSNTRVIVLIGRDAAALRTVLPSVTALFRPSKILYDIPALNQELDSQRLPSTVVLSTTDHTTDFQELSREIRNRHDGYWYHPWVFDVTSIDRAKHPDANALLNISRLNEVDKTLKCFSV